MPKRRTPMTPTIVVLILLFAGIYFTWAGVSSPSKIEISDMKIDTSSIGLAILFLAVALLIALVYIGRRSSPLMLRTHLPSNERDPKRPKS